MMYEGEENLYSLHRSPFLGRKQGEVEGYGAERVEQAAEVMQDLQNQMKQESIPENFGK